MNSNGNENGNGNSHSPEQGLRVHHLANLGGLIALAGLDLEPPDFLLGALLSVAREAGDLTPEQRAHVATIGRKKLDERATGKRAWKCEVSVVEPETAFETNRLRTPVHHSAVGTAKERLTRICPHACPFE